MRLVRIVALVLAAAALVVAATPPASAAGKTFDDKARGFRVHLDDKWIELPPKLTKSGAYIVGHWYADAAKYADKLRPEFRILWFPTAKAATVTPGKGDKPAEPTAPEKPDAEDDDPMSFGGVPTSTAEAADRVLSQNEIYFGPFNPTGSRFNDAKQVKKVRTNAKIDADLVEINPSRKKKRADGGEAHAWGMVAKLVLDRPGETIEVGFVGMCDMDNAKKLADAMIAVVASFEEIKGATDSRNLEAQKELDENDPEKFRAAIRKSKLVPPWIGVDTPHYMIVYPKGDVDEALAKAIGEQLEAIRSQVYEVLFPPDKPVNAISVVRCCKDAAQYSAYGGPGGSAGYWYAPGKELVFYEDRNQKKDSLRVLYHEGFHQFIYYSVGEIDPHSWFNEGHGDYFAGFNYEGGKFVRGKFSWRADSREIKRRPNLPPLSAWLQFDQGEYYGNNKFGLSIGENYSLGWDFIYFLRTTKKKEYQGILDKYFQTLKGFVTRARKAHDDSGKQPPVKPPEGGDPGGEGGDKNGGDPGGAAQPPKSDPVDDGAYSPGLWLSRALDKAFEGIDMKQLEKDWIESK